MSVQSPESSCPHHCLPSWFDHPFPSGTKSCRALVFVKGFGILQVWLKSPVDRFSPEGKGLSHLGGVSARSSRGEEEGHVCPLPAATQDLLAGHEPASLEGRQSSPEASGLSLVSPPCHQQQQQLAAGGPLRAACQRAVPLPAAGVFITCHVNISKESIQPALC